MCARVLQRGILVLLLLLLLVSPISAQETTPDPAGEDPILQIMDQMPPQLKVGQLVLVSFPSTNVQPISEIATLIREFGVGGVLLRPQNGNFGSTQLAPADFVSMTNRLQSYALDAVLQFSDDELAPPYIPLFVSVEANAEGVPVTAFVEHTSPLPTSLALGATWERSFAETTGTVLGQELAAIGVNLLLGPDLDVLYTPRPGDAADLGTNSLGGDPFWVGELGQAYITGLRRGSADRLLIAPRHMPGLGSADRVLEEEVPTVQKNLEQLKQIDLAPFFAVATTLPGESEMTADAFLVTHIRYRGFQGNIRTTTRPISLDAQRLQSVTDLEEISPWRAGGGVLIADNLALRSIRRFYDPHGLTLNTRLITQDALNAGNDLIILDKFDVNGTWDTHFENIRDTLDYWVSLYDSDATFKTLVDTSVYRTLSMKARIYPNFDLEAVQLDTADLDTVSEAALTEISDVSTQVALQALTRISPLSEDLLPASPQTNEPIVIFTQEHYLQLNADMDPFPLLPVYALQRALVQFYGPEGTGVVQPNLIQAFTFDDLMAVLRPASATVNAASTTMTHTVSITATVVQALAEARWIVFATTGLNALDSSSQALKTFLAEQIVSPDARIVVFSFGPPYELDSTEISKLDLYYALYSPGQAFVEVAARALFHEVGAPGASPVDIPALDYYLPLQTMPDPGQLITLNLVNASGEPLTSTDGIMLGDVVNLRTGRIVDQNGHPVPDRTPVEFVLSYPQDGTERTLLVETQAGIAETQVILDRVGLLVISVRSEPALLSVRLELTMREEGVEDVVPVEPTLTPTSTPTLTPTPTLTSTPTPTPTFTPQPEQAHRLPDPLQLPVLRRGHLLGWGIGAVLLTFGVGLSWSRGRGMGVVVAIRIAVWGIIGTLLGYISIMLIGYGWLPGWQYNLIGREYIVGGVSAFVGLGGLVLNMLRLRLIKPMHTTFT